IFMIKLFDNLSPDQCAQLFQVYNESRFRIWCTLDGNDQLKVMTVPVFVGTRAKHLPVFFGCPGGVVQLMGSVEVLFAAYVYHSCKSWGKYTKGNLTQKDWTKAPVLMLYQYFRLVRWS